MKTRHEVFPSFSLFIVFSSSSFLQKYYILSQIRFTELGHFFIIFVGCEWNLFRALNFWTKNVLRQICEKAFMLTKLWQRDDFWSSIIDRCINVSLITVQAYLIQFYFFIGQREIEDSHWPQIKRLISL